MMGERGPGAEDIMSNEEAMRMAFEMVKNGDRNGMMLIGNTMHNFFRDQDYAGAMRLLDEGVAQGVITPEKRSGLLMGRIQEAVRDAEIAEVRDESGLDPVAMLERRFADAPELRHMALDTLLSNTERKIAEQEQRLRALQKRRQAITEKIDAIPSA